MKLLVSLPFKFVIKNLIIFFTNLNQSIKAMNKLILTHFSLVTKKNCIAEIHSLIEI